MEWHTTRNHISYQFDTGIIRVRNDSALKRVLEVRGMHHARLLARRLREKYREIYHKPIAISETSLALEILWHYRVLEYCVFIRSIPVVRDLHVTDRIQTFFEVHMFTIDCGERELDNNRFVWDLMSRLS